MSESALPGLFELTPLNPAFREDPYALAVAILDDAAMVRQFSPSRIEQDDVWALIPKIKAHHEERFDGGDARGNTRLMIRFTDGSVEEEQVRAARSIAAPLSAQEVEAKFRTLTDGLISAERQEAIMRCVAGLENVPDIAGLVSLLAPVAASAFEIGD